MDEISGLGGLTRLVLVLFAYVVGGAATLGYFTRRGWIVPGNPMDEDGPWMGVFFWPGFWIGALVWVLFVKPLVPIIMGIYRISAGMTWRGPDA